ncbi:tRNA(Ile)-lysidine synthetase [Schizosaccharomyces japonicus yFS275]|uniref:tRNA(Ile)-lysidine synthetase n=1 Tax=Schizosaccharomyces japonicus (strain yFS275 / FY16936) TaxID=402676 RepID=B6JZ67_SCHJY|nr:tRNA(Ile)-lysidine synthetase [Schizosaccharomyces japonicus yFS275]EEB06835.1 tRNA(Ile)-lysidine synthetase [Schizosaccharomyces japonicus yFS275]
MLTADNFFVNSLRSFIPYLRNGTAGVAVSGGVDSMCLVHLLRETMLQYLWPKRIHAFIVEHGLRKESAEDAVITRRRLLDMGIPSTILPLNHKWDLSKQSKIETIARVLRYRTLAKACLRHKIYGLFTAHHLNDQYETIVMRLLQRKPGTWGGLCGIRKVAPLPESEDIYGADQILLLRPFLSYPKTCIKKKVQWCEDKSNKDIQLTVRNAIRAVGVDTLVSTEIASISQTFQELEDHSQKSVHSLLKQCSCLYFKAIHSFQMQIPCIIMDTSSDFIKTEFLMYLIDIITPKTKKKRRSIEGISKRLWNSTKPLTAGGCSFTLTKDDNCSSYILFITREQFSKRDAQKATFVLKNGSTILWDNRFWVQVKYDSAKSFTIRPLKSGDIKQIRYLCNNFPNLSWAAFSKSAPGKTRFTMPVIVNNFTQQINCLPISNVKCCQDVEVRIVPRKEPNLELFAHSRT